MAARVSTKSIAPKVIKAKLEEHDEALDNVEMTGVIPSARLNVATNPSDTNTVVIGGHTFKFMTALGAADATTQIKIGADAAASRALLVKAINGTADAANIVPATTPHTLALIADVVDTSRVRIRKATAKGGTAITASKASSSIAVSETLANAADIWDRANLNETGKADKSRMAQTSIAITAAMIAAGRVHIEFPFTPLDVTYVARSAAGVLLPADEEVTIEGNAVKIDLDGGAAPNLVATDIVTVIVSG